MWTLTHTNEGKWQLPPEHEEVILRIGDQFIIGSLESDPEDGAYFHVEGCLDAMDYELDAVYSWSPFDKPVSILIHAGDDSEEETHS